MGTRSVKIPWTTTVPPWRVEARQSLSAVSDADCLDGDVQPLPFRQLPHLARDLDLEGTEDIGRPQLSGPVASRLRDLGQVDGLHAHHLDGEQHQQPYRTSARDQDAIGRLDPSPIDCVGRTRKRLDQRRPLPADALGQLQEPALWRHHRFGIPVAIEGDDAIPDREVVDTASDLDDLTADFVPEGTRRKRPMEVLVHIRAADPAVHHADLGLTRPRLRLLDLLDTDVANPVIDGLLHLLVSPIGCEDERTPFLPAGSDRTLLSMGEDCRKIRLLQLENSRGVFIHPFLLHGILQR